MENQGVQHLQSQRSNHQRATFTVKARTRTKDLWKINSEQPPATAAPPSSSDMFHDYLCESEGCPPSSETEYKIIIAVMGSGFPSFGISKRNSDYLSLPVLSVTRRVDDFSIFFLWPGQCNYLTHLGSYISLLQWKVSVRVYIRVLTLIIIMNFCRHTAKQIHSKPLTWEEGRGTEIGNKCRSAGSAGLR